MRSPIILAVILALGLLAAGCGSDPLRRASPAIALETGDAAHADELLFGRVPLEEELSKSFTVRSVLTVPLEVHEIRVVDEDGLSAGAFTVERPLRFTVPGTQGKEVSISFRPTEVRRYNAAVVVSSSDPNRPEMRLSLSGEGIEAAISVIGCLPNEGEERDRCSRTMVEAPSPLPIGEVVAGQHARIQITIGNLGVDTLQITSVGFANKTSAAAAGFSLREQDRGPTGVAARTSQTLFVDFDPPADLEGPVSTTVVIISSDRRQPSVELPLDAMVVPNRPPLACLTIREIRRQGGEVEVVDPDAGPVVVGPTDSLLLDAAVRQGCTGDPEDGDDLSLAWEMDGPDRYGRLEAVPGAPMQRLFKAEVIGTYEVAVVATDRYGATSGVDEAGVEAKVAFAVKPQQDLAVELRWPDAEDVDLDLHLVRGDISGLWSDANDCSWRNPSPAWGSTQPLSNPRLAIDDQGGASLIETVLLNHPEPGVSYWIVAHFYEDKRSRSGAACTVGGAACALGKVCSAGVCMDPVEVGVRIFVEGEERTNEGFEATRELAGPCDTWLVGRVTWRSEPVGPVLLSSFDTVYPQGAIEGAVCDVSGL